MAKDFQLIKGGLAALFDIVKSSATDVDRVEATVPFAMQEGQWFGLTPAGPRIGGYEVTLADDASDTTTLVLPESANTAIWFLLTSGSTDRVAIIKVASTADTVQISGGAAFSLGTNANPDVDGDLNAWIQSSGILGIKNRIGSSLTISAAYLTL